MIKIQDILKPNQIALDLAATTPPAAVHEVAQLLRGDPRVQDWNAMVAALKTSNSCIANENGYGICIPHARTNHVNSMVMSVGRTTRGIYFEDGNAEVHYIFVIGVPLALAADYLRIIGALARAFRSPKTEQLLRQATVKSDFIKLLSESEASL